MKGELLIWQSELILDLLRQGSGMNCLDMDVTKEHASKI
jgi:hypothetical protein